MGWQTALIVRGLLSQPPTITGTFRTLLDFSAEQLAEVGIDDKALDPMRSNFERAYKSFAGWLDAELECLDSGPDQPASRITVDQSRAIERTRTPEQQAAYKLAGERRAEVVNAIVAAWIDPALRAGRRGDLVVDGMIVDLAGPSPEFTRQENRRRAAAYPGANYRRDARHRLDSEGNKIAKKRGWGIEVTAVTSVGPVGNLHSVPPLFTGLSIHKPTSGSLEGLDEAVRFHRKAGFDTRSKAANARRPLLVADMGYLKKGWGGGVANRERIRGDLPLSGALDFAGLASRRPDRCEPEERPRPDANRRKLLLSGRGRTLQRSAHDSTPAHHPRQGRVGGP
ncbi:hypothetical protein [Gordonia sp. ABSL49_1]|uniref:hypothetical protein n=1 Tax=Gordonia sp. ABSL49_1 TaxID=2920941 RepID=UPI001F0F4CA4|nr:hypothetical protein [Gordonia sp. ABSL49_1]MCH5644428.1 hypothetical protein [Gordonia sp. ABSL49_1]